jgi:hypothetical protein
MGDVMTGLIDEGVYMILLLQWCITMLINHMLNASST